MLRRLGMQENIQCARDFSKVSRSLPWAVHQVQADQALNFRGIEASLAAIASVRSGLTSEQQKQSATQT